MKTQATKSKPAVTAKASVKPAAKAKVVPKKMVKPAAPKSAVKKTARPVAKPVAKPVVKPEPKRVAKTQPVAVKKTAPVSKKPVAGEKSAPVTKPFKGGKPAAPAKPAGKAVRAVVKPAVAVSAAAVKPTAKPKEKVIIKTVLKTAASPAVKAAPSPATIAAAPAPLPTPALKPGRRASLRNSSFAPPPAPMIPTHSPDAAKASYSAIAERVIAPPPHVAAKKDPKLANNWKTKAASELTDNEVKAMPDSEYMNEKQLAFYRHKLSILKQEIHNSAGLTTEHLREDTVVVPDPADRATIEEEHALELRTRDRERKLLKKIEQSIARIDSGDYGYCDETGEAIGVGRLIARPTANLSLEAQQRRELKQKMFGD